MWICLEKRYRQYYQAVQRPVQSRTFSSCALWVCSRLWHYWEYNPNHQANIRPSYHPTFPAIVWLSSMKNDMKQAAVSLITHFTSFRLTYWFLIDYYWLTEYWLTDSSAYQHTDYCTDWLTNVSLTDWTPNWDSVTCKHAISGCTVCVSYCSCQSICLHTIFSPVLVMRTRNAQIMMSNIRLSVSSTFPMFTLTSKYFHEILIVNRHLKCFNDSIRQHHCTIWMLLNCYCFVTQYFGIINI